MYMARATLARFPSTNTIFWPRKVTPPPDVSNPLNVCDTENRVLKGLNIIMKTIMMGKMEMVLPDIHMMNKFMGTCLKGPKAKSQLFLIFKFGSASLEISECDRDP